MAKPACPVCAEPGQPVPGQTIKSLLAVSLRQLRAEVYRFCATPACRVVYFSDDAHTFTEAMVRERVFQKHPEAADTLVCYCFQYAVGDAAVAAEHARIVTAIRAGIQAGQCACDLRNPQGTCCLGNVLALARPVDATLKQET